MNNVEQAIKAYEKAGEEVFNVIAVAVVGRKIDLGIETGRELMDRLLQGQLMGAKAERTILEGVALTTAMEILKSKIK